VQPELIVIIINVQKKMILFVLLAPVNLDMEMMVQMEELALINIIQHVHP